MEVTLAELMGGDPRKRNVLDIKHYLGTLRRTGRIFFREGLSGLEPDTPFAVWSAFHPGSQILREALPVSRDAFQVLRDPEAHKKYLCEHYERYYWMKADAYDVKRLTEQFLAEEFVWYYRPI